PAAEIVHPSLHDALPIYGKMYGDDMNRKRNSFAFAWKKASQVWITGMSTGDFEKKVFNKEINEYAYGIHRPDYIGWIGGQPVKLDRKSTRLNSSHVKISY